MRTLHTFSGVIPSISVLTVSMRGSVCIMIFISFLQESENAKSLDEAYVCLKLAYELNVSRHIAEYFGAAMLPNFSQNIIQLFMEIMPSE